MSDYPYSVVAKEPGFSVRSHDRGHSEILLHSWSAAAGEAIRAHGVSHVRIETEWSETAPAAVLLEPYAAQIRAISSVASDVGNLSALAAFERLEELGLSSSAATVPFSQLPMLRVFWLGRSADVGCLRDAPALEELTFSESKVTDLHVVAQLPTLRLLRVAETAIASLAGLEHSQLETLDLQWNSRLRSVAGLGALPLRTLEVMGARKVSDIDTLGTLTALRELELISGPPLRHLGFVAEMHELEVLKLGRTPTVGDTCSVRPITHLKFLRYLGLIGGSQPMHGLTDIEQLGGMARLERLYVKHGPKVIQSLSFLRSLPSLQGLAITGSVIADGDLTPLIREPPLNYLAFGPFKSHYSHTRASLSEAVGMRIR